MSGDLGYVAAMLALVVVGVGVVVGVVVGVAMRREAGARVGRLIVSCVLATSVVACGPGAVPGAPAPHLVLLGPTTFDEGHVPRGQRLARVVRIRNKGLADLEITPPEYPGMERQVRPQVTRVAPGEEHELRVGADTGRLTGPVTLAFASTTNDPMMRSVRIELRAIVDPFVEILPSEAVALERFHDEDKKITLSIRSHEAGQLVVRDIRAGGDPLGHELRRISDSEYELQAWAPPGTPVGTRSGTLTVVTNSSHEPEREVQVRYTLRGRLVATGDLHFPPLEQRPPGKDNVTLAVVVTHVGGKDFSLVSASATSWLASAPDARVDTSWRCAGGACRVSVTQRGGAGDAGFHGKLALTSTLPGEPPVEIPLDVGGTCQPTHGKSGGPRPCPPPLR